MYSKPNVIGHHVRGSNFILIHSFQSNTSMLWVNSDLPNVTDICKDEMRTCLKVSGESS